MRNDACKTILQKKERIKMALVTMKTLLEQAEKNHRGIGAFSVGNMEMVKGAVQAAEELNTPIILQIAEVRLNYSPLALMGPMMVQAAREAETAAMAKAPISLFLIMFLPPFFIFAYSSPS